MKTVRRDSTAKSAKKGSRAPSAVENGHAEFLRQQICGAASALFISRGFGGTAMQDIADSLNISRPKLYYYFRDKSAILETLVRNVPVEAERRASAVVRKLGDQPDAALREMVVMQASLILERPLEFRLLDMSMGHLAASIQARAQRAKRGLLEAFTAVIRSGIERGVFRTVDPRVAAFAVIGMCNWTAAWYQEGGRLSAQQIAAALGDLALHTLLAPRHREAGSFGGPHESLRLLKEGVVHLELVLSKEVPAAITRKPATSGRKVSEG